MPRVRRVLLPTDFSEATESAAQWATWIAGQFRAELILLHVLEEDGWMLRALSDTERTQGEDPLQARGRFIRTELERWRERFGAHRAELRPGLPHEVIPEVSRALGVDLVCMGTHGRSGIHRVFFGSVAEQVVRTSPVPVLTVRPQTPPHLRRILVATDFSPPAQGALAWARLLSRTTGAEVVLLHVVELTPEVLAAIPEEILAPAVGGRIREYLLGQAHQRLEAVARPEEGVAVRMGGVGHHIVEAVQELHADLVCMGTHGRTGLAHLVLGSVAEQVVRRSPVPVLTVREASEP
ncbi:MAG: universal stress protein [Armatimonadota bacterium]|nr:universal stress protein [Armatimonadota bacterium]